MTKAWFGDADRMTPDELVNVMFPLSRRGRRGYEEGPVRRFLSGVHDEFTRLVKERTDLRQEVQRLRRRVIDGNPSGDPQPVPPGQADAHEIMQEAQQYADVILEDAHARAREAAVAALNTAPPPQSDRERQAAQAELAYLRTYSDVYRAHLRAYTEGILRGIEEWERSEAAFFQDTSQAEPMNGVPEMDGGAFLHY